jgi:hypothetical protein
MSEKMGAHTCDALFVLRLAFFIVCMFLRLSRAHNEEEKYVLFSFQDIGCRQTTGADRWMGCVLGDGEIQIIDIDQIIDETFHYM